MTVETERLPRRFHIGLQRAASTYLYALLSSHPDAALARRGLSFFATAAFDRGADWYLTQFPPRGLRIDSSPDYFYRARVVAPRIRTVLAGTSPRFILMLRNPIDYTASRFLLHRRTKGLRKRFGVVAHDLMGLLRDHPEYLAESRFAELLEIWLAHFPRRYFHVVLFEAFTRDTAAAMRGILTFLELPPHPLAAVPSSRNATLRHPALHALRRAITRRPRLRAVLRASPIIQRTYDRFLVARSPKLAAAERTRLRDLLAPDVARLKALLADPLVEWTDFV